MMNNKLPSVSHDSLRQRESGVTLIELMIAMVIGLFIIGTTLYVVQETQVTYRYNDHLAQIQEGGRFAVERIAHDVRMAGYNGCARTPPSQASLNGRGDSTITTRVLALPPAINPDTMQIPVQRFTQSSSSPSTAFTGNTVPNSDVLIIRGSSPSGVSIVGNTTPANAQFQISGNPDNFVQGDLLWVVDCTIGQAHLVRATTVGAGGGMVNIAHAANANSQATFRFRQSNNATVMRFTVTGYYLANSGRFDSAGQPIVSLFNARLTELQTTPPSFLVMPNSQRELVEGVQDMQVRYGLDVNDDNAVDQYEPTVLPGGAVDSFNAAAVQVRLLLQSTEVNITREPQAWTNLNGTPGALDRRMRQPFEVVATIRNRLP